MADSGRKNRSGSALGFIVCIIFGVIICIWPGESLAMLCRLAGLVILICGIYYLVLGIRNENTAGRNFQFVVAVILIILGIWILMRPGTFVRLIPIIIGIVLVYHGVRDIYISCKTKQQDKKWWVEFLTAVISLVLGIFLIFRADAALKFWMVLMGIILIYDGISGLWVTVRAKKNS